MELHFPYENVMYYQLLNILYQLLQQHIQLIFLRLLKTIQFESLKNQITTLKDLHADELSRRDDALKKYQDTVKKLEEQYQSRLEDLDQATEEQRDEIVEEIVKRKQFSENNEGRKSLPKDHTTVKYLVF